MAAAILVGAVVRLIDLGSQSYTMDELWELAIVRLPPPRSSPREMASRRFFISSFGA